MPVLSQTPNNTYVGNGSVTVFAYTFRIPDEESLRVLVDGVEVVSGFSISNVDSNGGGNVTFSVAPAADAEVRLERAISISRETDYIEGGALAAQVLDNDFDRVVMMVQDLNAITVKTVGDDIIDGDGRILTDLVDPIDPQDAATKHYVDTAPSGAAVAAAISASEAAASAASAAASVVGYSFFPATQYGATGDGSTDDTAAIQAAIDAAGADGGGTVWILPGDYKITATLTNPYNNVKISGAGSTMGHNGGTGGVSATKLLWYGSGGGTMVYCYTPEAGGNAKRTGHGVTGVELDGRGVAGIGLSLMSIDKGVFRDLHVKETTITAYKSSCYSQGDLADPPDTQNCHFEQCSFTQNTNAASQNAHGFWLTSENPATALANTSCNVFSLCFGQIWDGNGFKLTDADNNDFYRCRVFRVGTNPGVLIQGATSNSNHWWGLAVGGASGIRLEGVASGFSGNPVDNCFHALDQSNGTQAPVLDGSFRYYATYDDGRHEGAYFMKASFGGDLYTSLQGRLLHPADVPIYIKPATGIALQTEYGGHEWSIDQVGENLRLRKVTGAGGVLLSETGVAAGPVTAGGDISTGVTARTTQPANVPLYVVPSDGNILRSIYGGHEWALDNAGADFRIRKVSGTGGYILNLGLGFDAGGGIYRVNGLQVVKARDTGWAAMTGTANKGTSYATGSITLVQLAERVKALQDSLTGDTGHGLIGS